MPPEKNLQSAAIVLTQDLFDSDVVPNQLPMIADYFDPIYLILVFELYLYGFTTVLFFGHL